MAKTHRFNMLMESEFEKAEIAMAIQTITDTLTKQAEQLSKFKIEQIPAISGRIKAEIGLEASQAFTDAIIPEIDAAMDTTMKAKESIDTEKLKVTGDLDSSASSDMATDLDSDLGGISSDDEEETVDLDAELGDTGEADLLGDEEEVGGMEEVSREIKPMGESKESKCKVIVESKSGKIGSKTFKTLEEGKAWTLKNAKHIKEVKNILPIK